MSQRWSRSLARNQLTRIVMTMRVTLVAPGSKKADLSVTLTPAPGRHSPTFASEKGAFNNLHYNGGGVVSFLITSSGAPPL